MDIGHSRHRPGILTIPTRFTTVTEDLDEFVSRNLVPLFPETAERLDQLLLDLASIRADCTGMRISPAGARVWAPNDQAHSNISAVRSVMLSKNIRFLNPPRPSDVSHNDPVVGSMTPSWNASIRATTFVRMFTT